MNSKLIIVSGFLGSGKTTVISKLAKFLKNRDFGIITNDESNNLVDTRFLKSEGNKIFEIPNGCFCHSLDELVYELQENLPEIIIAEPIGSAVNLTNSVIKPIHKNYKNSFCVMPLSVVCEPFRLKKMISDPELENPINNLLFLQLFEADIILLNKIDLIKKSELVPILKYLEENFNNSEIIPISAMKNIGIDYWFKKVCTKKATPKEKKIINYESHSRLENSLAWLNLNASVNSEINIDFNLYARDLLLKIRENIKLFFGEIVHLKIYIISENDYLKAGITNNIEKINFNKLMIKQAKSANLLINARVNCSETNLKSAVLTLFEKSDLTIEIIDAECFSPNYKKPKMIF